MLLLEEAGAQLEGAEAVVVGRSNLAGKPVVQLLLGANATVTICHSRTRDLPAVCRRADVLIAAVGRDRIVKDDWIKPGATVIDVGINRTEDGLHATWTSTRRCTSPAPSPPVPAASGDDHRLPAAQHAAGREDGRGVRRLRRGSGRRRRRGAAARRAVPGLVDPRGRSGWSSLGWVTLAFCAAAIAIGAWLVAATALPRPVGQAVAAGGAPPRSSHADRGGPRAARRGLPAGGQTPLRRSSRRTRGPRTVRSSSASAAGGSIKDERTDAPESAYTPPAPRPAPPPRSS
jgi:hypothetical protein